MNSRYDPAPSRRTFSQRILDIPRPMKRLIALSIDAAACAFTVWLAYYLRLGYWPDPLRDPLHPIFASVAIGLPIFVSFGLYRAIFRFAGSHAMQTIIRAVALYGVIFAAIYTLYGISGTPRTVGLIQPILLFVFIGASRLAVRLYFAESYTALWSGQEIERVLIYGAGNAGRELAATLQNARDMKLVGFVDDDRTLAGSILEGVTIHGPDGIGGLVNRLRVDGVLLAIPSASTQRRSEIIADLKTLGLHVRTLPSLTDIARGKISVGDLKELDISDVLGRAPVPPDEALLHKLIRGKTVLVTGAGGSIGSELARHIAAGDPATLLLLDHSEFNLYSIDRELGDLARQDPSRTTPVPLLASVTDAGRIAQIFARWQVDTVFHAAAYKHVPLVEANLLQGLGNNVIGTRTVAEEAARAGVRDFVLISTDKAVRPTNVMGASKRCAEMVMQAFDREFPGTRFSMVRFGNVLGSSGSVVPLFRRQIEEGGPVTLTHADITRYFMSIPEAAQLVLQAGAMAKGGDVFVLDMGEPVRIYDLARTIIVLSGRTVRDADNPAGDIEIRIDGLRPGEKLYEELLIGGDTSPTKHERILRCHEPFLGWDELEPLLGELETAVAAGEVAEAYEVLRKLVSEFTPTTPITDAVGCPDAVSGPAPGSAPPSRAARADMQPS
ncbi:polysaccharide biosynthesis protein [Tsuneonella sp. SYSU-LHT278]|uniref:polysaccharide biosynthesis protein n=1 Tax=Tsuneonella sediminis TaxID=3416089 RepID=UPI003F79A4B6